MIKKIALSVLLIMVLLLLVLTAGSYFLLGTDTGFQFSANKLKHRVPGLDTAEIHGNLERGIQSEQISWEQDGLSITASGLQSKWSSACLIAYRYCLDKLALDSLKIVNRSNASPSPAGTQPTILPTISLPISVEVNELSIDEIVLDLAQNRAPVIVKDVQLKAELSGGQLEITRLIARYENYSASLSGTIDLKENYPIDAQFEFIASSILAGEDVIGVFNLNQNLRSLRIDGNLSGGVNLATQGTIDVLHPMLPADLNFSSKSIGWPLDTRSTVEAKAVNFDLRGDLNDYKLSASAFLHGENIPESNISLSGSINPQRVILPTITVLTLGGFATGAAAADFSGPITWVADVISKEINPAIEWPEMQGTLNSLVQANGVIKNGQWTINLPRISVDGIFRNFPLELNAEVNKALDDTWQISQFNLTNGPNSLALLGSYGKNVDITAAIDFPSTHFTVPKLIGNLTADLTLQGAAHNPSIVLDASSSLLRTGPILLRDVKLNSSVDQLATANSKLQFRAARLNTAGQQFSNLSIELTGTRESHTYKAFVDGPSKTSFHSSGIGSLLENYDWNGKITSSQIEIPANTWELSNNIDLKWQNTDQLFSIAAHCWKIEKAQLCLEQPVTIQQSGDADLRLQNYALNNLNPFLPAAAQLAGNLNAFTNIKWGEKETPFSASLKSDITEGKITVTDENEQRHVFEYQSLDLKSDADTNSVNSTLTIASRAMGNGKVSFRLEPKKTTDSLRGEIALRGFDIGFLQAFLPDFDQIKGNINARGNLSGSLSAPQFNGRISLLDPIFQSPIMPLSIDGGRLNADVNGEQAKLSGDLKSGAGSLAIGGSVGWKNRQPSATVSLEGETLSIVQNPITQSTVFPKLRIRYLPGQLTISGDIDVPAATIDIKDIPEGTVTLSEDVVVIEEEKTSKDAVSSNPLGLKIDVGIDLGDKVRLSGYGIQAALQGNFDLRQSGEEPPQLNGEIRVTEGFYNSYGQDLTISDGQILFVGPIESTTLNIDAVREIENENRVAGLHLEGPIADPIVTLFTNPADKSQESILAYIILGRDLGAGTSESEADLLATAALALALQQGNGFATGFAESLGISDFALEAGGSGENAQVMVSGRLSSRLLLRYGRSVFSNDSTLFLRYDISRKLYLEAAQGIERAVDVFYSFSF